MAGGPRRGVCKADVWWKPLICKAVLTCQVLRPWKKKKRAKPHTTAVKRIHTMAMHWILSPLRSYTHTQHHLWLYTRNMFYVVCVRCALSISKTVRIWQQSNKAHLVECLNLECLLLRVKVIHDFQSFHFHGDSKSYKYIDIWLWWYYNWIEQL